jgi:hypothetical protein
MQGSCSKAFAVEYQSTITRVYAHNLWGLGTAQRSGNYVRGDHFGVLLMPLTAITGLLAKHMLHETLCSYMPLQHKALAREMLS